MKETSMDTSKVEELAHAVKVAEDAREDARERLRQASAALSLADANLNAARLELARLLKDTSPGHSRERLIRGKRSMTSIAVEALRSKPLTTRELAVVTGLAFKSMAPILARLKAQGVIVVSAKRGTQNLWQATEQESTDENP